MAQSDTRIERLEEMRVAGIATISHTAMNVEASFADRGLDELWKSLQRRIGELDVTPSGEWYGVSWPADDSVPPMIMHYLAGLVIPEAMALPEGFSDVVVPGGNYLFFTHQGPIENIGESMREAYLEYLPSSNLRVRRAPHLEFYDENFVSHEPDGEMYILIPIE